MAIPLIVLGGFLGAGKTTVLNHWLHTNHGKKLMVLVNDFGKINIDAQLIQSVDGEGMIALRNGCVCCSIGGELVEALLQIEAYQGQIDALVIEASGVSDPRKIAQIGALNKGFSLAGICTVVDCIAFLNQLDDRYISDTVIRQLQPAHQIFLNKAEHLSNEHLQQVVEQVKTLAPQVTIVFAENAHFDLPALNQPKHVQRFTSELFAEEGENKFVIKHANFTSLAPQTNSHALHSFYIEMPNNFNHQQIEKLFDQMPRSILRAKGFIEKQDEVALLHYVREHSFVLSSAKNQNTSLGLVFISTSQNDENLLRSLVNNLSQ